MMRRRQRGEVLVAPSKKKKTKKSSKMMRRRQRGEVLVAPEIPLDLQIEIVNRLPIKSLARFKCVSKLWFSIISSKGYLFASSPRLYISSRLEHKDVKFELLSLSLVSATKSSTMFDLDLTEQGMGGYDMVALRGLILYSVCTVFGQACIYNPTTGQKVTLPTIDPNILEGDMSEHDYFRNGVLDNYFLGYDPVLHQYKVVCNAMASRFVVHHWVFVLEPRSSWKRIEFDHPHIPFSQGLCINGVIYYLADCFESGDNVISFDVRFEEFSTIQLPHAVSENTMYLGIIEYGGKPTLFDYKHLREDSLVNLWVLEDSGIWSKKSLVLQPCQMHFFPDNIRFFVCGTTQNGEVILKPRRMSYPYYILYYDLQSNDVRRVDIKGISHNPIYLALMDTGESILHLKI